LTQLALTAVHLATVGDSRDQDDSLLVVDPVHDAIVADADPEVVAAGELLRSARARVVTEGVDRRPDPVPRRAA
jgi:hypothetical protein